MGDLVVRRAEARDVAGVCELGGRDTYRDIESPERIESVIAESYVPQRIERELAPTEGWDGWFVAVECDAVVGAGGCG